MFRSPMNVGGRRSGLLATLTILLYAVASIGAGCFNLGPPGGGNSTTVGLQLVAGGFTSPVAMVAPPDNTDRLFVVDQVGRITILTSAGASVGTFLDVSARLTPIGIDFGAGLIYDERGLLGLAFHPQFASNGRFFIYYNAPKQQTDADPADSRVRLSEFTVSSGNPNVADAASERVLLEVVKPQYNHNGGQVAFGPDGYLYIGIGDGGGAGDKDNGHTPSLGNAQDRTRLLGKILRIDVDGGTPYSIPADNPFASDSSTRGEIWAFGLRNPYRFSFDLGGVHDLFAADVGQNLIEEVNLVTRGGNYGWRIREGGQCFNPAAPAAPPATCATTGAGGEPLIEPILTYPHRDGAATIGTSIIGGFVYRGTAIPDLVGDYVFGDYSTGFGVADGVLFAARKDAGGVWQRRSLVIAGRVNGRLGRFVLAFGQDRAGEVYVLSSANLGPTGATGQVHRLIPTP